MALTHIHSYKGNPTKALIDGVLISEGDFSSPLVVGNMNIATSEVSAPVKVALRCAEKLYTAGATTVSIIGPNADKWRLAPDVDGAPGTWLEWGQPFTTADVINDTNYIMWVQSRAVNTDVPGKDISTVLRISADIYGN